MTSSWLAERLVRAGLLRPDAAALAMRRQRIYGGGLDTVLLELGLVEEAALWQELVDATGLRPLPPALIEGPVVDPDLLLDAGTTRKLGAIALRSGRRTSEGERLVDVIVRPEHDAAAIEAALGKPHELFVVPEPRFLALAGAFYGEPVPPRILSLLARLMGAEQVRKWAAAAAQAPERPSPPPPLVETGPRPTPADVPTAADASVREDEAAAGEASAAEPPTTRPEPQGVDAQVPAFEGEAPRAVEVEAASLDDLLDAYEELLGTPHAGVAEERLLSSMSIDDLATAMAKRADERGAAGHAAAAAQTEAALVRLLARAANAARPLFAAWLAREVTVARRRAAAALALCDVEDLEQALVARATDESDEPTRAAAHRALRRRVTHSVVRAFVERLRVDAGSPDVTQAFRAIGSLGALRDPEAVEVLIERVSDADEGVAEAAHAALVAITGHDPGRSKRRWSRWWQNHREHHRVEWLIDALAAEDEGLRLAASQELGELTGAYVGYHFDLDPRDREDARRRWRRWWDETGRARFEAKAPSRRAQS